MATFAQLGFANTVTASSTTPGVDGYVGERSGFPYNIHPTATPDEWAALQAAITDNAVVISAYSPPVITLAEAQAAQTVILKTACDAAITGGFSAAALGAAYTYPSAATDQANLAQTAAAGGGLLMCESAAGVWALVAHSQAQAQAVLAAFIAWRDKQRQQLAALLAEVTAATTTAAVTAIVWP